MYIYIYAYVYRTLKYTQRKCVCVCLALTTSHFRNYVLFRQRGARVLHPDNAGPCVPVHADLDVKGPVVLLMQKNRVFAFESFVFSRWRQTQNITGVKQSGLRRWIKTSSCERFNLYMCVCVGCRVKVLYFPWKWRKAWFSGDMECVFVSLSLVWIHESVGMQGIYSAAMERGCFCTPCRFRTYFENTSKYGFLLIIEDMQKIRVFVFGMFSRWRQSKNATKIRQHICTS